MCLGKDSISTLLRFCGEYLEASKPETVLRIQTNNKLNFENYIKYVCSKAFQEIGALQKNFKSVRHAKEKSSVQFYNKISVQLLSFCLNVLLKKIRFFGKQCS